MCIVQTNLSEMKSPTQDTSDIRKKRKLLKRRKVTFSTDISVGFANYSGGPESDSITTTKKSCSLEHQQNPPNPSDTWYSLDDLEDFKDSTRHQAKRYRILSNKAVTSEATESSLVLPFRNCALYKKMKYIVWAQKRINSKDPSSSRNDSSSSKPQTPSKKSSSDCQFRGLEHRIFVERQRNKTIAIKTVLEFQRNCHLVIHDAKANQLSEVEIHALKQQHSKRLAEIYSQLSQWAKDEALAAANYDATGVYTISRNSSSDEVAKALAKLAKRKSGSIMSEEDDDIDDVSSTSSAFSSSSAKQHRSVKRARVTPPPSSNDDVLV